MNEQELQARLAQMQAQQQQMQALAQQYGLTPQQASQQMQVFNQLANSGRFSGTIGDYFAQRAQGQVQSPGYDLPLTMQMSNDPGLLYTPPNAGGTGRRLPDQDPNPRYELPVVDESGRTGGGTGGTGVGGTGVRQTPPPIRGDGTGRTPRPNYTIPDLRGPITRDPTTMPLPVRPPRVEVPRIDPTRPVGGEPVGGEPGGTGGGVTLPGGLGGMLSAFGYMPGPNGEILPQMLQSGWSPYQSQTTRNGPQGYAANYDGAFTLPQLGYNADRGDIGYTTPVFGAPVFGGPPDRTPLPDPNNPVNPNNPNNPTLPVNPVLPPPRVGQPPRDSRQPYMIEMSQASANGMGGMLGMPAASLPPALRGMLG